MTFHFHLVKSAALASKSPEELLGLSPDTKLRCVVISKLLHRVRSTDTQTMTIEKKFAMRGAIWPFFSRYLLSDELLQARVASCHPLDATSMSPLLLRREPSWISEPLSVTCSDEHTIVSLMPANINSQEYSASKRSTLLTVRRSTMRCLVSTCTRISSSPRLLTLVVCVRDTKVPVCSTVRNDILQLRRAQEACHAWFRDCSGESRQITLVDEDQEDNAKLRETGRMLIECCPFVIEHLINRQIAGCEADYDDLDL